MSSSSPSSDDHQQQQRTIKSFHRRTLPSPPSIPFSSHQGREIFKKSLDSGNLDGYFFIAEQFSTQSEPSFCGLASLR
jgi:glutathione gamma-glutamylcysteinyltransferase